jgi:hypothetical protein
VAFYSSRIGIFSGSTVNESVASGFLPSSSVTDKEKEENDEQEVRMRSVKIRFFIILLKK